MNEKLVQDEYQVVEFGPLGGEIGPVSSGHFAVGNKPDVLARRYALKYAEQCRDVTPATLATTYKIRRVLVYEVQE